MSPADQAAFSAANVNTIQTNVMSIKADDFTKKFGQAAQADNNVISAAYYLSRTNNLNNMATQLDNVLGGTIEKTSQQASLEDRQYEINEWSNSNKLDTLYFLQVLFICLTFISSIAFLKSKGIVSPSLFTLFSIIAGILSILVLILRARFTSVIRDGRYWNKVRFPAIPDTSGSISTKCS